MTSTVKNKKETNITPSPLKKQRNPFTKYITDLGAWLLLLPSAICIIMVIIRPQILGFIWSFFDMQGFTLKEFVGFDNYERVLTNTVFMKTLGNTVMYVLWSLVVGLLIPLITAILMNEMVHCRKSLRLMVYLPTIMPGVAVSLLWSLIYSPETSGLLNMFLGIFGVEPYIWLQDSRYAILWIIVSMTWSGMGSTAIYYFAALQGVNRELYEAALVDGAGFIKRVRVVLLPYIKGMLLLFGIQQCIGVFNLMEQPLQMTGGGPNNATLSLGLLNYRYAFQDFRPQLALALGVLMFFVILIFTLLYNKLDKKIQQDMA